jgi:hypothetical protein
MTRLFLIVVIAATVGCERGRYLPVVNPRHDPAHDTVMRGGGPLLISFDTWTGKYRWAEFDNPPPPPVR